MLASTLMALGYFRYVTKDTVFVQCVSVVPHLVIQLSAC